MNTEENNVDSAPQTGPDTSPHVGFEAPPETQSESLAQDPAQSPSPEAPEAEDPATPEPRTDGSVAPREGSDPAALTDGETPDADQTPEAPDEEEEPTKPVPDLPLPTSEQLAEHAENFRGKGRPVRHMAPGTKLMLGDTEVELVSDGVFTYPQADNEQHFAGACLLTGNYEVNAPFLENQYDHNGVIIQ